VTKKITRKKISGARVSGRDGYDRMQLRYQPAVWAYFADGREICWYEAGKELKMVDGSNEAIDIRQPFSRAEVIKCVQELAQRDEIITAREAYARKNGLSNFKSCLKK